MGQAKHVQTHFKARRTKAALVRMLGLLMPWVATIEFPIPYRGPKGAIRGISLMKYQV